VQVYVGGTSITPSYAGSAPGLAGVDQINFTLPDDVPTGCTVGFQIVENGVLSQETFLSIAPSTTATACIEGALTTSQLENLDNGGTIALGQASVSNGSVSAQFTSYTGFELPGLLLAPPAHAPGCTVTQTPVTPAPGTVISSTGIPMDAGTLTASGPSGSGLLNTALLDSGGNYGLGALPFGPAPVPIELLPGVYSLTGAGGNGVGPFNAAVTVPTPLAVSNFPTVVTRSAGLTLNWTGGNPADTVGISGAAANSVNGILVGAQFACYTTAGAGTFTIPASILNQLPASNPPANPTSVSPYGSISVSWATTPSSSNGSFSAPLTGGGMLLIGTFTGSAYTGESVAYQ
jgi:hypothetical protein